MSHFRSPQDIPTSASICCEKKKMISLFIFHKEVKGRKPTPWLLITFETMLSFFHSLFASLQYHDVDL